MASTAILAPLPPKMGVHRRASIHNPEDMRNHLGRTKSHCAAGAKASNANAAQPSPSPSRGPSPVIGACGKVLPIPRMASVNKKEEAARPMSRIDRSLLGDAYLKGLRKPMNPPPGPKSTEKHPLLHFLATSSPNVRTVQHMPPISHSFDAATDGFGRVLSPIPDAEHSKGHGKSVLSNSKEQYRLVRDTIHEAFDDVDLDKNGVIDKFELGHLLSKIAPLEHPVDDLDAIFDDVDTDRNGVIDPQEFRDYLEATLCVCEKRHTPIDLQTLVNTAFRDGFQRVRKERNIITKAFLSASQMFGCNPLGATTAGKSSWIFKMYDRLHSEHVDSTMVEGGRSGRLGFLEELLKEVCSLGELILMPIDNESTKKEKLRKSAAEKVDKIKQALFGAKKREEVPESMVDVIGFCSEWLSKLSETQVEEAGLGTLASDWRRSSLDALSASIGGLDHVGGAASGAPKLPVLKARQEMGSLSIADKHRLLRAPPKLGDVGSKVFDFGEARVGDPPVESLFAF